MKKCLLTITFLLGAGFGFSIEHHPDAVPNTHEPGEVDIPGNVKFVVPDPKALPGIVLDETDAVLKGQWQYSTHTPPYVGIGYLHDQKSDKGKKSVTWTPNFPKAGNYEVRVSHCYNPRRSTNTPVTIIHALGKTTIRINQQKVPGHGKLFRSLGVFRFKEGSSGSVTISNEGTEGSYVIVDAVQFLRESAKVPILKDKNDTLPHARRLDRCCYATRGVTVDNDIGLVVFFLTVGGHGKPANREPKESTSDHLLYHEMSSNPCEAVAAITFQCPLLYFSRRSDPARS